MLIKLNPFDKLSEKSAVQTRLYQYGNCSIHFKETHTLVKFENETSAKNAFEGLQGLDFCETKLTLQLLPAPYQNQQDPNDKYKPPDNILIPDLEMVIPSETLNFDLQSASDLSPGSNRSAFFPDFYESPLDSPLLNSKSTGVKPNDSPISVIGLPVSQNCWNNNSLFVEGKNGIRFRYPVKYSADFREVVRSNVRQSKVKEKNEKRVDFYFCAVCRKSIKKTSLKYHSSSKLHLLNLKLSS